MRLPLTLSLYIGRTFLFSVLGALLALVLLLTLIDVTELIRRATSKDAISFFTLLNMALLKAPSSIERLLPFAALIGSMLALMRLTRTQELIVARAAGVSVWQFLAPALIVTAMLGVILATVFTPLSSLMLLHYEKLEGRHLTGRPSLLSVSSSGLWLRQVEHDQPDTSEHVIYALRVSPQDMTFAQVIVFAFDAAGHFRERLDAPTAQLLPGALTLTEVTRSLPGKPSQQIAEIALSTELTINHIQDSFASPETMSFWSLPSFINTLEKAGFSALKHRIYWHSLLANPVLLCGMVLVAAVFSLRLPRRGKIPLLIASGVLTGFVLYFLTDITHSLGMRGDVPVTMAAWIPALTIFVIGTAMLLHLEDG